MFKVFSKPRKKTRHEFSNMLEDVLERRGVQKPVFEKKRGGSLKLH